MSINLKSVKKSDGEAAAKAPLLAIPDKKVGPLGGHQASDTDPTAIGQQVDAYRKERNAKFTSDTPMMVTPSFPVTTIPSKFKAYPAGCKIEYRPYTFGEIKELAQPISRDRQLKVVLAGLSVSNMPVEQLILWDVYYLSVLRRMACAKGTPAWQLKSTCTHCKVVNQVRLTEAELDFTELPDALQLPVPITLNGRLVSFMPFTVANYLATKDFDGSRREVAMLASMLSDVEPLSAAIDLLDNIWCAEEQTELLRVDECLTFGLKEHQVTCWSCTKVYGLLWELEVPFLCPFRETGPVEVDPS